MNPEGKQSPSDETGVGDFETKAKPYPEHGKEGRHGLGVWGDVKVEKEGGWLNLLDHNNEKGLEGQWLNVYTSPEIIDKSFTTVIVTKAKENPDLLKQGLVIVDAGGYDGYLLNTIVRQLEDNDIRVADGINVEADPKGTALPQMVQKIESGEYSDKIRPLKADIVAGMPIESESVDVVVSRCALQYSQQEQHLQFMKSMADILKPGGIAIIQFPSTGELLDKEGVYTQIHREISKIVTGGQEFRRDFPDVMFLIRFMDNKTLQSDVGLKAVFIDSMREWLMSPESWGDRFSLNEAQIDQIRQIYQRYQKEHPDLFEEKDGVLCLVSILERGMLQKVKSNKEPKEPIFEN